MNSPDTFLTFRNVPTFNSIQQIHRLSYSIFSLTVIEASQMKCPEDPCKDEKVKVDRERQRGILSHSQLFCHTSKSCVVNFAFFALNPFNLPRVVGWYHWNPQNRPKGALFRGYKKSRIFFKKSVKILNWRWSAHFWAHRHLSYHFGNL